MIGDLYIRTQKANQAYREALKQRQQIRATRFKDASEKQRKAVPSKRTNLKKLANRAVKAGKGKYL